LVRVRAGLSFPGVEQHVFGSTEHHTAEGFVGRTDILSPLVFDWRSHFLDKERKAIEEIKKKHEDILDQKKEIIPFENKARARMIDKYLDHLDQMVLDINGGKRPEVKTVFVDNFTPLSEDLWNYAEVMYAKNYTEKTEFKLWGDYYFLCDKVLDALNKMDCNAVVACHVKMGLDEDIAAKVPFFKQTEVASKKDWQPFVGGQYKFKLKSKFDYSAFMFTEEPLGQPTKYFADFRGLGKARVKPFEDKPILVPKGSFYKFLSEAINKQGGK
jgi:hypothetical protein